MIAELRSLGDVRRIVKLPQQIKAIILRFVGPRLIQIVPNNNNNNNQIRCCLCNTEEDLAGHGHNTQPLGDGVCCDDCHHRVLEARFRRMHDTGYGEEDKCDSDGESCGAEEPVPEEHVVEEPSVVHTTYEGHKHTWVRPVPWASLDGC